MGFLKRRLLLRILIPLGAILLLPVFLGLLVSLPAVQTRLTNFVASRALHDFGAELTVEKVRLTYSLDLKAQGVALLYNGKELLRAGSLNLDVSKFSYRKRNIHLKRLGIIDPLVHVSVARGDSLSDLQRFIEALFPADTSAAAPVWNFKVAKVEVKGMRFAYDDWNFQKTENGIDLNHLSVSRVDVAVRDINPDSMGLGLQLEYLNAMVDPGFRIVNLSSMLRFEGNSLRLDSLVLMTEGSGINTNLLVQIDTAGEYQDATDRFRVKAEFADSWLDFRELALFVPDLQGMDESVSFSGSIKGSLSNLRARDFRLGYAKGTRFLGDITLKGLPNIDETFINLKVDEMVTGIEDVKSISLPGGRSLADAGINSVMERLGSIRVTGYLTGFYYDFVSDATFRTDIGTFKTDISLKDGTSLRTLRYDGDVVVEAFDFGKMIDEPELFGMLSMNARVTGKGVDQSARFIFEGVVDSVDINGYNYDHAQINGEYVNRKFDGRVSVEDHNIDFDFAGSIDMSDEIPDFDFRVDLNKALLSNLKIVDREGNPNLRARFRAVGKGFNLDDLLATLDLNNLIYTEKDMTYRLSSASVNSFKGSGDFRGLSLRSALVDADLTGKFKFAELGDLVQRILKDLFPSLPYVFDSTAAASNYLDFTADLKHPGQLLDVIYPGLDIPGGMKVQTRIEQGRIRDLQMTLPDISLEGRSANDVQLNMKQVNDVLVTRLGASSIRLSDSIWMRDFAVHAGLGSDSIDFNLSWLDPGKGTPNEGQVEGYVSFGSYPEININIHDSRVWVNNQVWTLTHAEPIQVDTSLAVTFHHFKISSRNMSFMANGTISGNPDKSIDIGFIDYDLNDLDFLTQPYKVDLDGVVNGTATLRNLFAEPNVLSDLQVKGFVMNGDKLGDAYIRSGWNSGMKAVRVGLRVVTKGNIGSDTTLLADGWYYPDAGEDQLNIDFRAKDFRIHALKNFLSELTSDIRGTATGTLKLSGSLKNPVLVGSVDVQQARVKVDYLNTYYTFADKVVLTRDRILFNNIVVNDNNGAQVAGKTAILNGYVQHKNFRDFHLEFRLHTESFTFLNTSQSQNEYFYGRALGSGNLHISGPDEDIRIEAEVKSDKGTVFSIPLTYSENVRQVDFIQFVDKTGTELQHVAPRAVDLSGISMDFALEVTPDATVQLIFDEKIGDVIRGSGKGNFNMEVNTRGDFLMYGTYEIQKGEYLFTLQNVVNKAFTIQPGGTIKWTGDPYEADLDIEAKYTVFTSLHSLGLDLDTSRRRVPVECKVHLTGNLNQPNIERSIEFPGMNAFEAEQYKAAIQADLNYQFLALLVMNSFIYTGADRQGIGGFAGSALNTGYSEFLSSQISNWLSKISNDFDIGVNYRPEDNLNAEKLQVILSTQLLNDRLSIDGNFDMGSDRAGSMQGNKNASSIVGDVNVEYKITPEGRFRVKAFNRSNYHDVLNSKAPYTQGVGVFYRKEFDSIKKLRRNSRVEIRD